MSNLMCKLQHLKFMLLKKPLLLLLLFFCCAKSYAATFVVTSNADSGPGTLRDALTQVALADSSVTNYITFSIADISEAGRTIILQNQLPDIPSNVVIDGTTQPGNAFGVSSAKIALFIQAPSVNVLSALRIANKHDVTILGLYIKNIVDAPNASYLHPWQGIQIISGKKIQIGAAGKGNVIANFYIALSTNSVGSGSITSGDCRDISVKGNFFNIDADGETRLTNLDSPVQLYYCGGYIKIGGNAAEGNLMARGVFAYQDNDEDADTSTAHFYIQNNNMGVDYLGKKSVSPTLSAGIEIQCFRPDSKNFIDIEDNVINSSGYGINIGNNGEPINILRNYIGTNRTLTNKFTIGSPGIFLYGSTSTAIGDDNTADANYITNCNPVWIWPFTNATVNKNSFFCTVNQSPMHLDAWDESAFPVVNILKINSSSISGTATPNSSIELFYSDVCNTCSAQTYFGSATAGASGNWEYDGTISGPVIASATLGLNTSDFSSLNLDDSNVKITNACGSTGLGSITGIIPYNASGVQWLDGSGNIVGTNTNLINVKPGTYQLVLTNGGGCSYTSKSYYINYSFDVVDQNLVVTQPSCGNNTGSAKGLYCINNSSSALNFNWVDSNGKSWGTQTDVSNLPAGSYTLNISLADGSCSSTYGPVILKNTTGPNIDQSNVKIQPTTCGLKTGSITNLVITGTGTLKYSWTNDANQQVGSDNVLINQPAGNYKLAVTDDTQCGTVYSAVFNIPEVNGITLDETAARISPATCGLSNGYVTGIKATNATSYKWLNDYGVVVSNNIDLIDAPAGDYRLYAYNDNGCTVVSAQGYVIDLIAPTAYPKYPVALTNVCSNGGTGTINITTDALVKDIDWTDSNGQSLGNSTSLAGLSAGTYSVYFTDQYGCKTLYNNYTVQSIAAVAIQPNSGVINNDNCNLKTGSITGIQITGGEAPFTYTWTDANGKTLANTPDIANISAGTYTLNVNDASGCGNALASYTVVDEDTYMPAPSVSNVQLCSSGSALIGVNNASATGTYNLYTSANSTSPADSQTGGKFKVNVSGNTSFYITQISGTCESSKAEVDITVGLSALDIANTFTPNGDGINDYWKIRNIENYPQAIVQVFNRYGQKVFESKGYQVPFDGTYKGQNLPAGVYYYIINLNTNCSLLSGSLTILR